MCARASGPVRIAQYGGSAAGRETWLSGPGHRKPSCPQVPPLDPLLPPRNSQPSGIRQVKCGSVPLRNSVIGLALALVPLGAAWVSGDVCASFHRPPLVRNDQWHLQSAPDNPNSSKNPSKSNKNQTARFFFSFCSHVVRGYISHPDLVWEVEVVRSRRIQVTAIRLVS